MKAEALRGVLYACRVKHPGWGVMHPGCFMRHLGWGVVHPGCFMRHLGWGVVQPGCFMRHPGWGLCEDAWLMKQAGWLVPYSQRYQPLSVSAIVCSHISPSQATHTL
jgi:hypothetical protein